MSREWKPGDVAMLAFSTGELAIGVRNGPEQTPGWGHSGAFGGGSAYDGIGGVDDVRPLVVIDPEDREAVGRFAELIENCGDENHCTQYPCGSMTCWVDRIADALREFANPKPPKPKEPTGLGAVVEDSDGRRWVHLSGRWHHDPLAHSARYSDIDAVRVLSEGWSA